MYWFVTVTTGSPWDCAPTPYGSVTSTRIKIAAGKKTPLIECARAAAMLILIVLRRARRKRMMTKKNEPLTGSHPLLPNLDQEIIEEMLLRIGASSVEELFSDIPSDIRLKRGLRLPEGQSESVVRRDLQSRLASNKTPPNSLCFLGGGVWPHYIPAAVESVVSRQEFYTSYTPYQPEISQGMLQALFEYQSLMCDLLRMEACNSSMYDWASAAGEAARMASKVTGRRRFLLCGDIGPTRLEVIRAYVSPMDLELESLPFDGRSGATDFSALSSRITSDVAGVYVENPNYFGVLEEGLLDLYPAAREWRTSRGGGRPPLALDRQASRGVRSRHRCGRGAATRDSDELRRPPPGNLCGEG